jgi:hypothetical protein
MSQKETKKKLDFLRVAILSFITLSLICIILDLLRPLVPSLSFIDYFTYNNTWSYIKILILLEMLWIIVSLFIYKEKSNLNLKKSVLITLIWIANIPLLLLILYWINHISRYLWSFIDVLIKYRWWILILYSAFFSILSMYYTFYYKWKWVLMSKLFKWTLIIEYITIFLVMIYIILKNPRLSWLESEIDNYGLKSLCIALLIVCIALLIVCIVFIWIFIIIIYENKISINSKKISWESLNNKKEQR